MTSFFHGWQRKTGCVIFFIASLRLVFSWHLDEWCYETRNGWETRYIWGWHPDLIGFVLLTFISAYLLLWKPRKPPSPNRANSTEDPTARVKPPLP